MTDTPDPRTTGNQDVAAPWAIPGDRQPTLCRVAATVDGSLPPPLARLLLDTHTSVGDVAVDIDDDIAFAAAAAVSGRRHHALAGDGHLATLGHAAGYIDLILLHWPRPAVNPRLLLLACRALLRNAGRLAVAATVTEPSQRINQLSALSGAAASAGLHLIDHISAIAPVPATDPADETTGVRVIAGAHKHRVAPMPHTDLLVFGLPGGAR
jgi:hypothetical protein